MFAGNIDADFDGDDWPDRIRLCQGATIEHLDEFNTNISSLLDRPQLSDLTLVIEGQEVKVNRSILAVRSEYFHALLYNGMKESNLDKVELPSTKLKPFKTLLKFIYAGKLKLSNLNADELSDLLITARIFCFNKIVRDISTYLRLHINKDNVWSLYRASKLYNLDRLATACERFFDKNAEGILQHEDFMFLDTGEVCEMIKRDSFYAQEQTILRAVCRYYGNKAHGSPEENAALLEELLLNVRLSLLKSSEIKAIFFEYQIPFYEPAQLVNNRSLKKRTSLPIDCQESNRYTIRNQKQVKKKQRLLSSHYLKNDWEATRLEDIMHTTECLTNEENISDENVCSKTNDTYHPSPYARNLSSFHERLSKESIRGYLIYNRNIATKEYDVEPVKGRLKKDLVCGSDRNYTFRTCTNHSLPHAGQTREECIQVAFGRPFIVNNIRMLLLDDGQRSFSYIVEVSTDSRNWVKIVDYSKYWCRSWQHLFFSPRVVRHVRITGSRSRFYGNPRHSMLLVYFECMYNSIDSKLYALPPDQTNSEDDNVIEPKASIVDASNTIAFSSSSPVGSTRHFRLRSKTASGPTSNAATLSHISSSSQSLHHLDTSSNYPYSLNNNDSNNNNTDGSNNTSVYPSAYYRTTDFARGSVNWISPGKVTFQLAQPFKISSFAFKIIPLVNEKNFYAYSINVTNDLEAGPWTQVKQVSRMCNDLFVVKFEPQIVTFIEVRIVDHPNLSHFSIRHFECPFSCA